MWGGPAEVVFACGWNKAGQLGLGGVDDKDTLTAVGSFNKSPIPLVACGSRHTLVYVDRQDNENVYVCGRNAAGQLGIDKSTPDAMRVSAACHRPFALPFFHRRPVSHLACGSAHSIVATHSELWGFGMNNEGQLGLRHTKTMATPVQVNVSPAALDKSLVCGYEHLCGQNLIPEGVACGCNHTTVVTVSGEVWSWGSNQFGQLGVGDELKRTVPTRLESNHLHNPHVEGFGRRVVHLAVGSNHTLVGTTKNIRVIVDGSMEDGVERRVFSWGSNSQGQLGLGHIIQQNCPQAISCFDGYVVDCLGAGEGHSVIATNGLDLAAYVRLGQPPLAEVYSFGCNSHGQLGLEPCEETSQEQPELQKQHTKNAHTLVHSSRQPWLVRFGGSAGAPSSVSLGNPGKFSRLATPFLTALHDFYAPGSIDEYYRINKGGAAKATATEEQMNEAAIYRRQQLLAVSRVRLMRKILTPQLVMHNHLCGRGKDGKGARILSVACGRNHTSFLTEQGHLYSAGSDWSGQLGLGLVRAKEKEARDQLHKVKVESFASSLRHNAGICDHSIDVSKTSEQQNQFCPQHICCHLEFNKGIPEPRFRFAALTDSNHTFIHRLPPERPHITNIHPAAGRTKKRTAEEIRGQPPVQHIRVPSPLGVGAGQSNLDHDLLIPPYRDPAVVGDQDQNARRGFRSMHRLHKDPILKAGPFLMGEATSSSTQLRDAIDEISSGSGLTRGGRYAPSARLTGSQSIAGGVGGMSFSSRSNPGLRPGQKSQPAFLNRLMQGGKAALEK